MNGRTDVPLAGGTRYRLGDGCRFRDSLVGVNDLRERLLACNDPDDAGQASTSRRGRTSRWRVLMAVAKQQRADGLQLWTFEANQRARRFYERHGFVATGSTEGDNEEGAPDVRYEWSPSGTASQAPEARRGADRRRHERSWPRRQ